MQGKEGLDFSVFSLITWAGPVIGCRCIYLDFQVLFWIGTCIAAFNLFMNVASGAMRFPVLPAAAMILGAILWMPWYVGAALGLLAWTAIEALSEIPPISRLLRRVMRGASS
jgi:hypothetical protein